MRRLTLLVAILGLLTLGAGTAFGHAVVISTSPVENTNVATSPTVVTLTFSEPVVLLRPTDLGVVNSKGQSVAASLGSVTRTNQRQIQIALRPKLPEGTYTVLWQVISADSHDVGGEWVFGVGSAPLGPPYIPAGLHLGPSENSVWAVSARFLEITFLGGLLGMMAFRWLVWRPAARRLPDGDGGLRLGIWGRDLHWTGFGLLAAGAMLAEGYLLVVKTATFLDTTVRQALGRPADIARVLGDTRFGTFAQLRAGMLFGVFVLAIWQFLREVGRDDTRRPTAGQPVVSALMGALTLAAFATISVQGHASTSRFPDLEMAADIVHLAAASVWIAGMLMTLLTLWRAPRIASAEGRAHAAITLARYSRVALVAVSVAVASGVVRTFGELNEPSDLWNLAYGRSILIKIALLLPVAFLGLRHKRIVLAVERVDRPNAATLAMVRRSATLELLLSLAIVVVASVLVAQVPPPRV